MTTSPAIAPGERPVALLTGAGQGLGAALARFLAGANYDLILNARHGEELSRTAEAVRTLGAMSREVVGDIAGAPTRDRLVRVVSEAGRLDLVVNNASELGATGLGPLSELALPDLDRILSVNLVAPLALLQELLPWLRASHGLVVNVSSDAAVMGYPGWGAYASSKAALDSITRTLANELRGDRVSVVSVDPGEMRTAMHQAAYPGQDISDRPPPEVTLPFWAWLLGRPAGSISGLRFQAQARSWEVPA